MSKKQRLTLKGGEFVLAAWAERAAGPGWANSPVFLVIQDGNGKLRSECLQPDEQTDQTISTLFSVSAVVSSQMRSAVERVVQKSKR